LAGHNKRRRKTHPENLVNEGSLNDEKGSSYLLISLLRILSNLHCKHIKFLYSVAFCPCWVELLQINCWKWPTKSRLNQTNYLQKKFPLCQNCKYNSKTLQTGSKHGMAIFIWLFMYKSFGKVGCSRLFTCWGELGWGLKFCSYRKNCFTGLVYTGLTNH
jgi:hypothetical protein